MPVSGALDHIALRLGNALVGNPQRTAALEIRMHGPTFRVEAESIRVALTGTSANLEILEITARAAALVECAVEAGAKVSNRPTPLRENAPPMAMVKHISMLTAGCMLLIAGAFPASAQYRGPHYDRDREAGFSLRLGDDHD